MNHRRLVLGSVDHPRLVILRGVPGSGMSLEANLLSLEAMALGLRTRICSTDDHFKVPDAEGNLIYEFDPGKLDEYHERNRAAAWRALTEGIDVVIINNTNTTSWEVKTYVELAFDAVYQVQFHEPSSPAWRQCRPHLGFTRAIRRLIELAAPLHAQSDPPVPVGSIARMMARWENEDQFAEDVRELLAVVGVVRPPAPPTPGALVGRARRSKGTPS